MKVTREKNALVITIDGAQYQVLTRIADALNTVESGHTAESVCEEYLMAAPTEMLDKPRDLADYILGDARFDGAERLSAFQYAFIKAGLWGRVEVGA